MPITRQAIAKHLALLTDTGLVTAEPGERRRVRYRLRSAPTQVAQQFLVALARTWDGRLDHWKIISKGDQDEERPVTPSMTTPPIVSEPEWEEARQERP